MDREAALQALADHLPIGAARWYQRRPLCKACEQPHPCPPYLEALDELVAGTPDLAARFLRPAGGGTSW